MTVKALKKNNMERKSTNGGFKMKGHTLPGINQRMDKSSNPDGKAKSSVFQKEDPVIQGTVLPEVTIEEPKLKVKTTINQDGSITKSRGSKSETYVKNPNYDPKNPRPGSYRYHVEGDPTRGFNSTFTPVGNKRTKDI
tara:strand:+ start:646 stop:1059 length:414 start_codon:yes stop_codon:yes gene_type:complete